MEGNKDEAARCIGIAEAAIVSGDKQRALKFIRIAQRLNPNLQFDDLLSACEKLESTAFNSSTNQNHKDSNPSKSPEPSNGGGNYTEEHVKLIREVRKNKDYYTILGVEKTCSVEEIRKAYRKLSLKVHPDKNKAPGSEEAFKKVCKAFKCLSDEGSRRQYDQTGLVEEFEYNQQHNNVRRRRRRRTANGYFEDDFDPEEIFRSFFGQADMFRTAHVYRTRGTASQQRENTHGAGGAGGPNLIVLLQILPFIAIFLLAYLPFSEPNYSLEKTYSYHIPKVTEKYGVEFYVKSSDFELKFPLGSPSRVNLENLVVREYKNILARYCHVELQRRHWNRNYPTPNCDRLQSFGMA